MNRDIRDSYIELLERKVSVLNDVIATLTIGMLCDPKFSEKVRDIRELQEQLLECRKNYRSMTRVQE